MERIEPTSFQGPRAYFTDFDHRIVSRRTDLRLLRREVGRRLKVLLLTKGTVVCAASHLTSEFAYSFFRDNSILLEEKLVVPALRRDMQDIGDVFEEKAISGNKKREMVPFYQDNLLRVVNWDLFDNSIWFRNSFLRQLEDTNSILRRNLEQVTEEQIHTVIQELKANPILRRDVIERFVQPLADKDKNSIRSLRELLYHISGSKVINCEGHLPQENYLDYKLEDISRRTVSLSDVNVFWKIFLETAFDTLRRPNLPMELMDIMTFEDIHHIRTPLLDSDFQEHYDQIIKRTISSIKSDDPSEILLNAEEIMLLREHVRKTFDEIFEKELKDFTKRRRKKIGTTRSLLRSGVSLALGLLGSLPNAITSTVADTASVFMETPSFVVNLSGTIRNRIESNAYKIFLKERENILRDVIRRSEISEKTPLLDTVDILAAYLSEKVRV